MLNTAAIAAYLKAGDLMANDNLKDLIGRLLAERGKQGRHEIPADAASQFRIYRSLVNIRPAEPADADYLRAEDAFLTAMTAEKGITDADALTPVKENLCLWQGDITTLRCGAIVNAANSGMTGCWQPCHSCIDNCIHTFAGVRLRLTCAEIMEQQGHPEPTGHAKITPAYNLPCDYVIHTVGPIVQEALTETDCKLLADCYRSCLETAAENGIRSIAFCCISTGVFGFPQQEAAEIAVRTVTAFCSTHPIRVIFNVFKDEDRAIYSRLLRSL